MRGLRGRRGGRGGYAGTAAALSVMAATALPGAVAMPGAAAVETAAKPAKGSGFVPVRQLVDAPLAGVSPAKGELWLLENGSPERPYVLEHLKSGRWTTTEVAPVGAQRRGQSLAATARDDVWLSVAGTLRHYDGSTWSQVTTPTGPNGTALMPGALATVSRGTLYAAMAGADWSSTTRIFRYAGGQWTDLGSPPGVGHYFSPDKIVVLDSGLSVLASNYRPTDAYDYVAGTWTEGRRVAFNGGGTYGTVGGYYVTSAFRHLTLGGGGFTGYVPTCQAWTAKGDEQCVSTVVAGASDQLKNGSIVIGGNDYSTPQSPPAKEPRRSVEATFVLRAKDGSERQLTGDPGSWTELMIAERRQNSAWAVTAQGGQNGPVYTLQRYDG